MIWKFLVIGFARAAVVGIVEACRHGARSPIDDHYWDTGYWDQGLGELTQEGMRQQFFNGAEFRNRYMINTNVLNPSYTTNQIYVRSTGYNRTIMSAQSQLMGWFPVGPSLSSLAMELKAVPPITVQNLENITNDLGMQALPNYFSPVPVHVVDLKYDNMLYGYSTNVCPYFKVIQKMVHQTADYKYRVANYTSYLQKQLYNIFGEEISYESAGWYADNLICDQFHGYPWPNGMTDSIYQQMAGIMNYSNSYFFQLGGAQLASSQFYSEILTIFNGIINKSSHLTFGFFSAHDTTLVGFLSAIENFNGQNPPFASTLIFELLQETNGFYVNIKYNDQQISIPGCQSPCPFASFQSYLKSWIIEDVVTACKSGIDIDTSDLPVNLFMERAT
jgi:hypothetical protein